MRRHHRMHAGVQHREERIEHGRRNARAADGHARTRARTSSRARRRSRMTRTDADGARAHGALLIGASSSGGIGLPVLAPSAEVDAVDGVRRDAARRSTTARAAATRARAPRRDSATGALLRATRTTSAMRTPPPASAIGVPLPTGLLDDALRLQERARDVLRLFLVAVDLVVQLGHRRLRRASRSRGSALRRSSDWRRARPCARPARGNRAATGSCRP